MTHRIHLALLSLSILLGLGACNHLPVDPIVPVRTHVDTNIKADQVNFTVEGNTSQRVVLLRRSAALEATVVVHKDTASLDSTVRNYVLQDSAVLWSIVSGPGSISSKGVYTAPSSMSTVSQDVLVSARASVSPAVQSLFRITVRKPNYQPTGSADYWVRDTYPLDSTTGVRIVTKKVVDSTVVRGTQLLGSKNATVLVNYRNGQEHDTSFVINDQNTIYQYTQLNDKLNITALQTQWIKLIDPNLSSWIAFDTSFVNQSTRFNGQPAVLNGSVRVVNTLIDSDSLSYNNLNYEVQQVQSVTTVNLILDVNGVRIPLQYTRTTSLWVSDNMGVMRSVNETVQAINQSCNCCIRVIEESVLRSSNLR